MKIKARDRREMEMAEERAKKQYEECNRASEGEKNAAILVSCRGQQKQQNPHLVTLSFRCV